MFQLFKAELPPKHGFGFFRVRVGAVRKYVEKVAVVNLLVPVPHEVSKKKQLLPEEPAVTHIVLETPPLFASHVISFLDIDFALSIPRGERGCFWLFFGQMR